MVYWNELGSSPGQPENKHTGERLTINHREGESETPTVLIGLQLFAINILNVTFFQEQTELRPWRSVRVLQDLLLAVEPPTNVGITSMWSHNQEVLL